ncbi:MAG TPA: NAD(P)/FAD-dependent oxidoreductase [Bacilli bacterium]|nr:NAD(P)/FAD-dependent oxidoreductase [Bacilli bacterium]
MTHKVALIGGGVSSVTLALLLKENFSVTIFERDDALLKKLRRTGNGRANIFNRNMDTYFYNDQAFMSEHTPRIVESLDEFFAGQKILTYTDDAFRVYPYSQSARVLRENLLSRLSANVKLNTNIKEVTKENDKFIVNGEAFDFLVVATGSSAGLHGLPLDNGNNFLLESLALKQSKFVPVIKTLALKEDVKALQNIRVKARLSLYQDEQLLHAETGELMFKKDGLSGIVSFIVSSYFEWAKKKAPKSAFKLKINLMPEYTKSEVEDLLLTRNLKSFFDERLVTYLLSKGEANLAENLTNLTYSLVSANNPENTQAMNGGVNLDLIKSTTFNLKKDPRVFVLGEALNIDGISGGYNLAFAFYTAIKAAKALNDTFCQ